MNDFTVRSLVVTNPLGYSSDESLDDFSVTNPRNDDF